MPEQIAATYRFCTPGFAKDSRGFSRTRRVQSGYTAGVSRCPSVCG